MIHIEHSPLPQFPSLIASVLAMGSAVSRASEKTETADPDALVHPGIKEQLSTHSDRDADFVIIGSGPGGYYAAIRAAQLGARVIVVEKGAVGGTCLNVGCIPTKVLLSCVGVLDHVKRASEFGVSVDGFKLALPTMMKRKTTVVTQLVRGVESLFRKNKIKLIRGVGKLVDAHTVSVRTDSGEERLKTRGVIIATGSAPALLPISGLDIGRDVWTSTEALEFEAVPKKLLVIGAGAIGLEGGYTFASLGSEVLVVEMMPQILPATDSEIASELQKHLEKSGMKFMLESTVTSAKEVSGGREVEVKSKDGTQKMTFDKVLVAVGRRAMLDGIGLDEAGIEYEKKRIPVNDHMQTNVPSVYAIGDVVGEPMLAHVAWAEALVAVEHSMGMDAKMSYKAFPACVYTTPEAASVGLTEAQAREKHADVRVGKFGFSHNGKAMGMGETEGFVKVISEPKYGEILGVHMVGPHVTDLITEAVEAITNELTVAEMIATIHPHPTLSEVVQEAAMDVEGRGIHQ